MSNNGRLDRKNVLIGILRLERDGESLKPRVLHQREPELFLAARRYFGSWRQALLFAGVDAKKILRRRCWSRELVTSEIRKLCVRGFDMRRRTAYGRDSGLVAAAGKHFGSWSQALDASGVDSQQFCKFPKWDRDQIIEAILLRAVKREPLGGTTVRPRTLKTAAVSEFGSWTAALAASGLDPKQHIGKHRRRKTVQYKNRDDVKKALLQRHSLGHSLQRNATKLQDRRLVHAIRAHFECWVEALRYAGLDGEMSVRDPETAFA